MVELIIVGVVVLVLVLVNVYPRVFWGKYDWRKPGMPSDWDESASRGAVKHRGVHVALSAVRRRERNSEGGRA
jgi:hypothetical protein